MGEKHAARTWRSPLALADRIASLIPSILNRQKANSSPKFRALMTCEDRSATRRTSAESLSHVWRKNRARKSSEDLFLEQFLKALAGQARSLRLRSVD